MPEPLRALAVILTLSLPVFAMARISAARMIAPPDFRRRCWIWVGIAVAPFLTRNFWLYALAVGLLLVWASGRERNKPALYVFLLFAAPSVDKPIPGFGLVNYLFNLDYLRLLSLAVLLPAALELRRRDDALPFGRATADKLLILYVLWNCCLAFNASTFTDTLRRTFLYVLDILLPFYVVSRGMRAREEFRDTLTSFVVVAAVMAAIGLFESLRHWPLYRSTPYAMLGVDWAIGPQLVRGDMTRAIASTGQPIPFGFAHMLGLGFVLYLWKPLLASHPPFGSSRLAAGDPRQRLRELFMRILPMLGALLLLGGLFVSLSRGPWLGAIATGLAFLALGRRPLFQLGKVGALALVATAVLLTLPQGEQIIDLLPFVGGADVETISYREKLLEITIPLILDKPLLGNSEVLFLPVMESLRQGEGIIDVVNTYIGVALQSGLPGLILFTAFFLSIGRQTRTAMGLVRDKDNDAYRLGQALLATLAGIMVTIFTVSSISVIPYLYWSVAGLALAYGEACAAQYGSRSAKTTVGTAGFALDAGVPLR